MSNHFNAPAGVSWGMPNFYDDELPCLCGHTDQEHELDGPCTNPECRCQMFEPDHELDEAA